MPDRHRPTPDEALEARTHATEFVVKRIRALRALVHGKLFDPVPGSTAWGGREWRNVADHCITVARALEAVGELTGMTEHEREHVIQVGMLHDWNKRLTKDPQAFTDAERRDAEAHAKSILHEHDPNGHLFDATEAYGLERLETDEATLAEHVMHFIDLSCMPNGLVTVEERFDDLEKRHAVDPHHAHEDDAFWQRKKAVAKKEERMILDAIRRNGVNVPKGARLRDVIARKMRTV